MKFRTALFCAYLLSFAVAASGQPSDIAASAQDTQPLQAGDRAPAFTVYEVDGTEFAFDPGNLESPALIITFRGGWCPYCNLQLQDLRKVIPEITERGMDVLFLSGDRPELLYSSLELGTQDAIDGLDYHILSDAKMSAARALGVAYRVPENTKATYEQRGRDIDASSIDLLTALPVPAVFVVDTSGTITFAHADPDFRVRLPAEEVKAAAEPLLRKF